MNFPESLIRTVCLQIGMGLTAPKMTLNIYYEWAKRNFNRGYLESSGWLQRALLTRSHLSTQATLYQASILCGFQFIAETWTYSVTLHQNSRSNCRRKCQDTDPGKVVVVCILHPCSYQGLHGKEGFFTAV